METYDEIYGRMKNAYEQETGDSFNEVSDIAIRLKVLAGEIFKLQTNLEWWKRQMFAVSASGECLDKLASQRGIERKKAIEVNGRNYLQYFSAVQSRYYNSKGMRCRLRLTLCRYVLLRPRMKKYSAGNTPCECLCRG